MTLYGEKYLFVFFYKWDCGKTIENGRYWRVMTVIFYKLNKRGLVSGSPLSLRV